MKTIKTFIFSALMAISLPSFAFAQVEVEVGGKVEVQAGFRGNESAFPFLIPSDVRNLLLDPLFLDPEVRINRGVKSAIVTDSLIDIWATNTYEYECLGRTTYGAKIELFADPTANKYSVDSWEYVLPHYIVTETSPVIIFPGSVGFIPIFSSAAIVGANFIAPFINNATPNPGPAREAKIFVENKFGKFEIGDTIGASKHLQVDAATLAVGSGGIAGDARLWASQTQLLGMFASADMITNKEAFYYLDTFFSPIPTTIIDPTVITLALLKSATFDGVGTEMRYSGKASYYTPRCGGFAGGISYIPDTDSYGSVSQIANISRDISPMAFKDVIEGGINYDCKVGDVGIKAAIVGEVGKPKRNTVQSLNYDADGGLIVLEISGITLPMVLSRETKDLRAYEFGLGFDYCGGYIAGSYGVNRPLMDGLDDNRYWTIGAAYTYCDFGVSVNYMDNRQKSKALREQLHQLPLTIGIGSISVPGQYTELKYRNFVLDVEYRICDGFIPYASYANINVHQPFNANMESKFNQGIGLIGLRILF